MRRLLKVGLYQLCLGGSLGIFFVAFLVFAVSQDRTAVISPIDNEEYQAIMSAQVADIYDLEDWFIGEQYMYMMMTPPDPEFILTQPAGLLPFEPKAFPNEFRKNLVAVYENSVPVYPITILEDFTTRAICFYNADGQLAYSIAAEAGYDPYAYAKSFYPNLFSGFYSADEVDYIKRAYDPARIHIQGRLIAVSNVESFLYAQSQVSEAQTVSLSSVSSLSSSMMLLRSPLADSNIVFESTARISNGLRFVIGYPDAFTNRLEIFMCTNMPPFWWQLAATNLSTMGTNEITWIVTNTYLASTSGVAYTFAAGNADLESDGDGLKDAREFFIYHTSMNSVDTDGDGLADGYSGVVATNSYPGGISTNGATVVGELSLGTASYMADTDGDGLDDGIEFVEGYDPLNPDYPPNVSGTITYAGRQTGSIWIVAVTASESWATNEGVTIFSPGIFQIPRLLRTNYYLKAFRDSDGNGMTNATEAFGLLAGNPIVVTNKVTEKNITMADPDTDTDTVPDWWEVLHFGSISTWGATNDPDTDSYSNKEEYDADTQPTNSASHPHNIEGSVAYTGVQTGTIYVLATTSAASWVGIQYSTMSSTGAYVFTHLPPDKTYYVKAWRDTDGDGTNDFGEGRGEYGAGLYLDHTWTNIVLTMQDEDSDSDGLPDWWEVKYGLDPFSGGLADLAWWKLNEASGTNAYDSTINANTGTLINTGADIWQPGLIDNALLLDGTNDYVQVPDSDSLKPDYVSLCAWVKPSMTYSSGTSAVIFSKKQPAGAYGYELSYSNGYLAFLFCCSGVRSLRYPCVLTNDSWYHVAGTYGGSQQRLYIDGSLVAVSNYTWGTGFGEINQSTTAPRLGASTDAIPTNYFAGLLDNAQIYTSELTSNDVYGIYQVGADPDDDSLSNYQEFKAGTDPGDGDTDDDGVLDGQDPQPTNSTVSRIFIDIASPSDGAILGGYE